MAIRNPENIQKLYLLKTPTDTIKTEEIKIRKGIFPGDTLSALWFNMCLNPLSTILNKTKYGYQIRNNRQTQYTINHLMYVDDIKLYAATGTQLNTLLRITENFTSDIKMQFGIEKCKTTHTERGQWITDDTQRTLQNETLKNLEKHETYKYLGFEQNTKINHTEIKKYLQKQYKQRLTKILKTKLNSKNLVKAINTYAITVLTYSFGIINWSNTDLGDTNRITRTHLTKSLKLHPKSCVDKLTISREEGGRRITDIKALHNRQIKNLRKYFHTKETQLHKAITKADKNHTPLNLSRSNTDIDNYNDIDHTQSKINAWAIKQLHGKHYYTTTVENINKNDTYEWLKKPIPRNRRIPNRNSRSDDKCRKCKLVAETIEHITGGCKILANTEYTERHNMAAKIIHKAIVNKYKLENTTTPYYKYTPTTIIDSEKYKLYWDTTLNTDKTIKYNRPDITFTNKEDKTSYLIDIPIPNDINIPQKYREKIEKYTPLAQKIHRIWKQKNLYIIPFIISATDITPNNFKSHLTQLQLDPNIHQEIRKAIILKTCNIIRAFLNSGD
ncbi:PREDICTED: uncharacterized protein LOC107072832 [Polistes dominula]|uniref:Uncharacterized protein LOC107072832 n=1 Tax=Polistes dominula TaxID=743375 RepID=A0ABM1J7Y7_POLDO|nr:PREDICTED: uncharacterized protein LOC107072832 [Polistes dominula]